MTAVCCQHLLHVLPGPQPPPLSEQEWPSRCWAWLRTICPCEQIGQGQTLLTEMDLQPRGSWPHQSGAGNQVTSAMALEGEGCTGSRGGGRRQGGWASSPGGGAGKAGPEARRAGPLCRLCVALGATCCGGVPAAASSSCPHAGLCLPRLASVPLSLRSCRVFVRSFSPVTGPPSPTSMPPQRGRGPDPCVGWKDRIVPWDALPRELPRTPSAVVAAFGPPGTWQTSGWAASWPLCRRFERKELGAPSLSWNPTACPSARSGVPPCPAAV